MKRIVIIIGIITLGLFSSTWLKAQDADRPVSLILGFGTKDYQGELGNTLFSRFNPNGSVGIGVFLTPSFDVNFIASAGQYDFSKNSTTFFTSTNLDANAILKYKFYNGKIFKQDAVFAPYLMIGLGLTYIKSDIGVAKTNYNASVLNVPAGLGFRIRADENFSFFLQSLYNYNFDDKYDGDKSKNAWNDAYFFHSVGLIVNLSQKKDADKDGVADKEDKCPETPIGVKVDGTGCPIDTDKDGIPDHEDACPAEAGVAPTKGCPDADNDGIKDSEDDCPNQAGIAQFKGCPDSDNDGIKDSEDDCPKQAGIAQFKGCPDSDGDGIKDSEDECPTQAGSSQFRGCPDSDGDGVRDKDDKCPTKAGPASNGGCPEVKEEVKKRLQAIAKNILFETGSDVIKKTSFATLDQLAAIMKSEPDYRLSIEGHTDNTGNKDNNLKLSQKRADAVKKYLLTKGILEDHMTAQGFGDTRPIADNKTPAGRTQNRRVDLKLDY